MHGNNGKKSNWGPQPDGTWIPSDRCEMYSGPNREVREQYRREMWERERQEREGSKPNTQLGSSSTTGASSSKSKNK